MEAVFADSATEDIKFVNPDLIAQVRALEQHIDQMKRGMSQIGTTDVLSQQTARFVQKWGINVR
jgi:hypothetical protein